jgi:hypothetical protein
MNIEPITFCGVTMSVYDKFNYGVHRFDVKESDFCNPKRYSFINYKDMYPLTNKEYINKQKGYIKKYNKKLLKLDKLLKQAIYLLNNIDKEEEGYELLVDNYNYISATINSYKYCINFSKGEIDEKDI